MEIWMEELLEDIKKHVGDAGISHYQTVIIPQVLMDFYKMLQGAGRDRIVSEEYRMEDGSFTIRLTGKKNNKGKSEVIKAEVVKNTGLMP
ncbi:MAG: hypothetical protein K6F34_08660 [Lachnospiraceae bacterium]|nr:hypothetical protein [Lachnospiraceae bacterium]